jgi:DNA-binding MarR family transcriptional regulator
LAGGDGAGEALKLKAKEKVLLQLRGFPLDPEAATLPFEATQKGLAEHLSLRRSHVAVALQDLIQSGLVECRKGRVEGEDRRLNVYTLRPAGSTAAAELWDRVSRLDVDFESDSGVVRSTVEGLVSGSKLPLASIVTQLERGGPVRTEITIVTQPKKRAMTVYCPTCERHMEVDNIYVDEEVGFDCPGCGRPYRIVPALRERARELQTSYFRVAAGFVVIAAAIFIPLAYSVLSLFFMIPGFLVGAYLLATSSRERKAEVRGLRSRVSVMTVSLALGGLLLLSWHIMVKEVRLSEELAVFGPMLLGVVLGYVGIYLMAPEGRAEFLIGVGILVSLIAVSIMFVEDFSELGVGTAPFLGVLGATMLAFSSFEEVDDRTVPLAVVTGVGAFLLLLIGFVIWPYCDEVLQFVAVTSIAALGVLMVAIRFTSGWTGGRNVEHDFINSVPLAAAFGMVIIGVYMAVGGATLGAMFELAVMLPFAYLGVVRVFDAEWMYKLPFTTIIVAVEVLVATAALST